MPSIAFVLAAAAVLLLLLALKLRGPRVGRDLTGPPRPKPRRMGAFEARRLADLVDRGESGEALRLIREAGYDDAAARKLVRLIERLGGETAAGDPAMGASPQTVRPDEPPHRA